LIHYGVCIGSESKYRRCAVPGLELVGALERTIESRDNSSIFPAYNGVLDAVRDLEDLEALVLLHEDLELRDANFEEKVRTALSDADVAIVGAVGGRGPRGVRWSKARERFGLMPDAFWGVNDYGGGTHDVDIVDGCLLILSPWAVRNLRFDDARYHGFHAYDADICMQARSKGRRVRVTEFDAYHHTKGGFGDVANHAESDATFRAKWDIPPDPWYVKVWDASPALRKAAQPILKAIRR
jgi:hypothetical protein